MWSHAHPIIVGEVLLALALFFILYTLSAIVPPRHPRNIPAVPFWVTLLALFRDIDQEDVYRRYIQGPLQSYGAVKIYFAGQWNLLVQRPAYLAEIFKTEEIYQKSGNQKKIPHSVFAEFLGDNVISSRDATWRLYRDIVTAGLQLKWFSAELETCVTQGQNDQESPKSGNLGARLLAARDHGVLTQKQFRDNLNVLFVAGQENPQLLLISILYLLAKHPEIQCNLRDEVERCGTADPCNIAISDLPYLTSVIYEGLRLLPPISQLINRKTSQDVVLGENIYIPKGTYVGYNCYSTNRDPAVWGPTADEFRPERWGSSNGEIAQKYRQRRARAEFVSFHGGSRACLGEKFALLEARVALFVLVNKFTWKLDPEWPDRKTPDFTGRSALPSSPSAHI
ncbi:hypothetical protein BBP40_002740 [Aspergillus hancockii]|nr:hypothetical protein BBP40_002740 [Aspergillus hancockii]